MKTTYKYIGLFTLALLLTLLFLCAVGRSWSTLLWLTPLWLLMVLKFTYGVSVESNQLVVRNIFGRAKPYPLHQVDKVAIHSDPFFYSHTAVLRIYLSSGVVKSYHLGLHALGDVQRLQEMLPGVRVVDHTR